MTKVIRKLDNFILEAESLASFDKQDLYSWSFNLNATDGSVFWSKKVRFLDIWDELCPLSKEDLAVKCHDAFLSYETPPEIYMKATQLDQALEISWGFLHSRELKVLLGKINLLPQLKSLNANLWDLLTSSLDQITVIQKEVAMKDKALSQSRNEMEDLMKRYSQWINERRSEEEFIYSQFTRLLNEKKMKIKELMSNGMPSSHFDRPSISDESDNETTEDETPAPIQKTAALKSGKTIFGGDSSTDSDF